MPKDMKKLSLAKFNEIENVFKKHFHLSLEMCDMQGKTLKGFTSKACSPEFCRLVQSSPCGAKRCKAERDRAVRIAVQIGQSYVCMCHAGLVLVCVPVMDKDQALGGIFFGKCLWGQVNDVLQADITKRVGDIGVDEDNLARSLDNLSQIPGRRIQKASEFLTELLYEMGGLDGRVVRWRSEKSEQQSRIGEFIQEKKKLGTDWQYPLDSERELLGKVKIGDRTGAKEILNSILGTIMFANPGELGLLKVRLLELLSILSRAAVEGGVDVNVMLEKNLGYINKVIQIGNQEDLCAWISKALNEFIELVYTSADARKVTQISPAINYIDANYDKQVTLAEVAKACCLSVSRLAHLFKEQMGITVLDYLTHVRIERAKQLLLATEQNCTEICFQVGYNNQSYFTRTFKQLVGMTPRQFRGNNQRKK
jgi:two-component system response regulator YesN